MPADAPEIKYDVFISYARKDANMGAAPLDSALKPLCRVWRDRDSSVRAFTAIALGQFGDARAVKPLVATLSYRSAYVRFHAVRALEQFKDNAAAQAALNHYHEGKINPRD
jgi:HEAT repeat protein